MTTLSPEAVLRAAAAVMNDLRNRGEFCAILAPNKSNHPAWVEPGVQNAMEARFAEIIAAELVKGDRQMDKKALMIECVNAHDRCFGGASEPCPYCEPVEPPRHEDGKFAGSGKGTDND